MKALSIIQKIQPTHVIQMGDLLEQRPFSRFAGRNGVQAEKELESGNYFSKKMWADIREISPQSECIQLIGNHDLMALRRAQERLPAAQTLVERSIMELYRFDGVHTHSDHRAPFWVKDVRFIHGYKKFGDHAKTSGHKTVCGHSHKGGVLYMPYENPDSSKRMIWELNAGWLGDEFKFNEVFGYTPERMSGYTLGIGHVDDYGPRFIPIDSPHVRLISECETI